jgi:hypothetical protein
MGPLLQTRPPPRKRPPVRRRDHREGTSRPWHRRRRRRRRGHARPVGAGPVCTPGRREALRNAVKSREGSRQPTLTEQGCRTHPPSPQKRSELTQHDHHPLQTTWQRSHSRPQRDSQRSWQLMLRVITGWPAAIFAIYRRLHMHVQMGSCRHIRPSPSALCGFDMSCCRDSSPPAITIVIDVCSLGIFTTSPAVGTRSDIHCARSKPWQRQALQPPPHTHQDPPRLPIIASTD